MLLQLSAFYLTLGNVDDRKPIPRSARGLPGKLPGDQGYVSQKLQELLIQEKVELITRLKKDWKNRLLSLFDFLMAHKQALIETATDQLKTICQIEHNWHRNTVNFCVNVMAALIAYTFKEKLPLLDVRDKDLEVASRSCLVTPISQYLNLLIC